MFLSGSSRNWWSRSNLCGYHHDGRFRNNAASFPYLAFGNHGANQCWTNLHGIPERYRFATNYPKH
jgi:hypothetical protein